MIKYKGDGRDVQIPDSVTHIGERVFFNCYGLKSIAVGNGVVSIGEEAFYNCEKLEKMTLGNALKEIGKHAFSSDQDQRDIETVYIQSI